MPDLIPDKNVDINGKIIGANTTVKLSVKTALWVLAAVVGIVMSILTYSYFDLKKDVTESRKQFIESVNNKVEKIDGNIQTILIDQAVIKGDIKLVLDRQNRDNPIRTSNVSIQPVSPPPRSVYDTVQ